MLRVVVYSLISWALIVVAAFADTAPAVSELGAPDWIPRDGDVITFDVTRKGKPFGVHEVSFARDADGLLQATTRVKLTAGLGFITLFKYELNATETWRDNALVALDGQVNDNGRDERVSAWREGEVLSVSGSAYSGQVTDTILPASHWNAAQTGAVRLLSTENGQLLEVEVINQGRETLTIQGQQIPVTRYLMDSDIDVSLWYDDRGRWLKLAFTARGQDIEYTLRQIYG